MPPLDTSSRAAEKEAQRKKWVGTVDGKEYLFVVCDECHQPHARQQVIRVPREEVELWRTAKGGWEREDARLLRVNMLVGMAIMLGTAFVGGSIAHDEQQDIVLGLCLGLVLGTTLYLLSVKVFLFPQQRMLRARLDATRKTILVRAGTNAEPHEVGTLQDAPRAYVLLETKPEGG